MRYTEFCMKFSMSVFRDGRRLISPLPETETGIRPMGACRTDTLPVSNGFDKAKSFAAVCR
jgi:hypothetical protein